MTSAEVWRLWSALVERFGREERLAMNSDCIADIP